MKISYELSNKALVCQSNAERNNKSCFCKILDISKIIKLKLNVCNLLEPSK